MTTIILSSDIGMEYESQYGDLAVQPRLNKKPRVGRPPGKKPSLKSIKIRRINQKLGKRIEDYNNGNEQYKKDNYDSFIIARNRLVKVNMGALEPIIRDYENKGISHEELKDIALTKLYEIAAKYKPELSNFYSFAKTCIHNEFKSMLKRKRTEYTNISIEDIEENSGTPLLDRTSSPLENALHNEISGLLGSLEPREAEIIACRYGFGKTRGYSLREVSKIYSISRPRVWQIEMSALKKLRKKLDPDYKTSAE